MTNIEIIHSALTKAWQFIENVTDEDPNRTTKFFELRAQVREAFGAYNEHKTKSEQPVLAIVVESGLVQCVTTNTPYVFEGINTVLIDYDVDSPSKNDSPLGLVVQLDGSNTPAYIKKTCIENATIHIASLMELVNNNSYGSSQQKLAVCGQNPCLGCPDINSDGERCVNDDKCHAWHYYRNN